MWLLRGFQLHLKCCGEWFLGSSQADHDQILNKSPTVCSHGKANHSTRPHRNDGFEKTSCWGQRHRCTPRPDAKLLDVLIQRARLKVTADVAECLGQLLEALACQCDARGAEHVKRNTGEVGLHHLRSECLDVQPFQLQGDVAWMSTSSLTSRSVRFVIGERSTSPRSTTLHSTSDVGSWGLRGGGLP